MSNYKSSQCIISINIFTEYLFSRKDVYQSNQCRNKWDFPIKLGVCFTSFSFGLMLDKIFKAEEFRSKQRKIMVLSNQSLRRKCFFLCFGVCSKTIAECEFVRCLFALDEVQWGQSCSWEDQIGHFPKGLHKQSWLTVKSDPGLGKSLKENPSFRKKNNINFNQSGCVTCAFKSTRHEKYFLIRGKKKTLP